MQKAFALIIFLGVATHAHGAAPAEILVYGTHQGTNIVYHYKIINNGTKPIYSFTIGVRPGSTGDVVPMLQQRPVDWRYGQTGEVGTEILLSESSTSQPAGWRAHFFGQEETDNYYLEWSLPTESQRNGIAPVQPGQTLGGFSVTLPQPDNTYLQSDVSVFWGAAINSILPLQLADTTPPRISIALSRVTLWPPNNKLAPITANISVNDAIDPAPQVTLESITANESLTGEDISGADLGKDDRQFELKAARMGMNIMGRVYTLTYSATDGSGNRAAATATVTVVHDQRK